MGDWMSFLEEALSSSSGPLLASLSAFWLRLSEKASSLGKDTTAVTGLCPGRARARMPRQAEHHHGSSSTLC